MKKLISFTLAAALLCMMFAGCGAPMSKAVKIGYVSSQSSRAWEARFKSYEGYESKRVAIPKDANVLKIAYSVAAETGTLRFTLEDVGGTVLLDSQEVETPQGTVERLGQGGEKYILRITGDGAKNGSFALAWEFINE